MITKQKILKKSVLVFLYVLSLATPYLNADQPGTEAEYQFLGRHLIVSYKECDHEALINVKALSEKMKEASNACGAQLLNSTEYCFPGNGLTMVCLLSESHASIHTYPEYNACFVDLFTCGNRCSAEKFDAVMREYLKPQKVDCEILERQ